MHGRSITVYVRASIIGMLENGASTKQAARHAGVNKVTEFKIRNRFRHTGPVKNRPKSGRPKLTIAAQDRFIRVTAYASA